MEKVNCSICQKEVSSLYCGDCGQKITRKRTTFISLISDLISKVISFEKSVPSTILALIKHPKHVVENYMAGNRNYYSHPGNMLFWALTIGAFHVFFINEKILGGSFDLDVGESDFKISAQAGILCILLIVCYVASHIAFLRSKQGTIKHLISVVYVSCAFFILSTIFTDILCAVLPSADDTFGMLVFLLFTQFWLSRVHTLSDKKYMVWVNFLFQVLILTAIILALNHISKN